MDFQKGSIQQGLGCSFLLERKQRISIEDRGDLYIKNTQTQVRELYRRKPPIEPHRESSSPDNTKLLETSLQVDVLHKKIENEIGKLKKFRNCFLKVDQSKTQKKKKQASEKHLTWREKLLNKQRKDGRTSGKGPLVSNRKELQNVTMSSPDAEIDAKPFFRTMSVVPTSNTSLGAKLNCKKKPADKSLKVFGNPGGQKQRIRRMCGGCIFGHCNGFALPQSVYQKDYGGACDCRLSRCPRCNPYNCCCCGMPGAVPVPYSPNPCYQYPQGAFGQQCDPLVQQMPRYDMFSCNCPRQSYSRRKTDLNIDEICRDRRQRATAKDITLSRSPSPNSALKSAEKVKGKSTPKNRSSNKNKNRDQENILKVSLKKQEEPNNAAPAPVKEEMIIKEYVPVKPPEDDQMDQEKMRMHREYMEMYKMEHDKTAGMESRLNLCDPDTCPTYTKLPTEQMTLPEVCSSYITEKNASETLQEIPSDQCRDCVQSPCQEECTPPQTVCVDKITKTVVSKTSVQQVTKFSNTECEAKKPNTFQKRTLSVRRNQVHKSSCQTDRVICSPDPNGKDRNVNRSPSPSRSKPSPSIIQSSQTPPNNPLTPGFEPQVSSYKSLESHTQKSSTRMSTQIESQNGAKDSQASPERQTDDLVTEMGHNSAAPLFSENSSVRREFSETDSEKLNATQSYTKRPSLARTIESDPCICSLRTGFVNDNSLTADCEFGTAQCSSNAHFPIMDSRGSPAPDTTNHSQQYVPLHKVMSTCLESQQTICHSPSVELVNEVYTECNCSSSTHDMHKVSSPMCSGRTSSTMSLDCTNQIDLPMNSECTEYSSFPDCPVFNRNAPREARGNTEIKFNPSVEDLSQLHDHLPVLNDTFLKYPDLNRNTPRAEHPHGNTEIKFDSSVEDLSQFHNHLPNFNETLTCEDQGVPEFSLCQYVCQVPDLDTSILKNCASRGHSIIRTQHSSFKSTLHQKRSRSVTFEDECGLTEKGNCCRSVIDWEEVHNRLSRNTDSIQEQLRMPEETNYSDNDDFIDSFRSSSTADTEFTCNESNCEEEYESCNENRNDREYGRIPPFKGCPCMYNEYLKLAALCRLPTRLE